MAIADDISVDRATGDIRYTGPDHSNAAGSNYFTVIDFHRYLQDKADDASATGDDQLDITSDTPSDRSTDNIIKLEGTFNISQDLAEHLYDGSISQLNEADIWVGLVVVGAVPDGTILQVIRNGAFVDSEAEPYWGATSSGVALNGNASANILMRTCVKVKGDGAKFDGQRLRVQAREFGEGYAEFALTAALGNNTAAVFTATDLNNATSEATIQAIVDILNTEGLRLIDVDNDTVNEEYYSEWDRGANTINDLYEYTKWIQKRPSNADANAEVGNDFTVTTATATARGTEFSARANHAEILTSCKFRLKVGGGSPTGDMLATIYDSDDVATAAPTGAILATSEPVLAEDLTSAYSDVEFTFNDDISLVIDQEYFIVIQHANGDGTDFVHVEGDTTSADDGNVAVEDGGWTGTASQALHFEVRTSPPIHTLPGSKFRGVTHSVPWDLEGGGIVPALNQEFAWGTLVSHGAVTGTLQIGEAVHEDTATPLWIGRIIAIDSSALDIVIALESGTVGNTEGFTGQTSGATATTDATGTAPIGTGGGLLLALAIDDDGATGNLYAQTISGAAVLNNEVLYLTTDVTDTLTLSANATARTVSPAYIGQSTGSALIGAYGIGVETADLTSSDLLTDLSGTANQPPNNVQITVSGVKSGEDYILLAPRTGTVIDISQLTLEVSLSGAAETQAVMTLGAPLDTPTTGTVRIQNDDGTYRKVAYSSLSNAGGLERDTFVFTGPEAFNGAAGSATAPASQPRNTFISYLDLLATGTSENVTIIYDSDRDLFLRVRDGGTAGDNEGIKTFENVAVVFGNTPQTVSVIRTSDV